MRKGARARYLYNKRKQYQEDYWNRRGAELAAEGRLDAEVGVSAVGRKPGRAETVRQETDPLRHLNAYVGTFCKRAELEKADRIELTINRANHKTDEGYIRALEAANRTMLSEHRRLSRLMSVYQNELLKHGLAI